MFKYQCLTPDYMYDDIFAIDLQVLKQQKIVYLLFDIDNTLTEWNAPEVSERTKEWFNKVRQQGFICCLISNNKGNRAKTVAAQLNIGYISDAAKPFSRGFIKAFKLLNAMPKQTAIIGDQLFTDIWGGNRQGITTILVKQIGPKEHWGTRNIFRRGERLISKKIDTNYREKKGSV
ncbi:MAG: YqeG family HAD IIIA-type phosphatase [Clostridia bacterium]|nr:YqeG family HAD IIIA-type phosphatase [Clostridia bacterium]